MGDAFATVLGTNRFPQLDDLRKGIRRRRKRMAATLRAVGELIQWGRTGIVPPSQVCCVVDTRKMSIVPQFQDFVRQDRRDTLARLRDCTEQVLVERAVANEGAW